MRATIPESGPKKRLLDIAEELCATKGFDSVSIRDVTKQAEVNVAAVNYHFGSREALLKMVMMRYMVPVTEERLAGLNVLERRWSGKVMPLEDLIEAFVRPLITQVKKSELSEQLFYKLLGRILAHQGEGESSPIEDQLRTVMDRFSRAFSKVLPDAGSEELTWRIHFMVGGMLHMLTHQDGLHRITNGRSGKPEMQDTLQRFIRYTAAGMRDGQMPNESAEKAPQAIFNF